MNYGQRFARSLAVSPLILLSIFYVGPANADPETTTYEYDAQGRLVKTSKSGGPRAGQQKCTDYDAAGNRTSRTVSASGCTPGNGGGGGGSSPSFSVNDPAAVVEGNSIAFRITKTGAGAASISYATANGQAGSADFQAKSGSLSFASGDTSKTVLVTTLSDSVLEGTETFTLNLSGATGGATISDAQGLGTILNDDGGQCSPFCQ